MKVHTFTIPPEIGEGRLYPLIRRMLPEIPDFAIREAFVKRDVKMGGVRVARDAQAVPGADVCLYTAYEGMGSAVPIVFQDERVLVVRKPAGVSCEADAKGGKAIAQLVEEAMRQTDPGSVVMPLLCHRLDNQTDGLLLLAKDENTQQLLMEAFKRRQIHKTYVCLVKGIPTPAQAMIEAYLIKDASKGKVRVVSNPRPGALPIATEYRVLEKGEVSRVQVVLHTGRTHQIRAQMAAIGHPLLGDDLYGDRAFTKAQKTKGLMLCATKLSFALVGALAYLNEHTFSIEPLF